MFIKILTLVYLLISCGEVHRVSQVQGLQQEDNGEEQTAVEQLSPPTLKAEVRPAYIKDRINSLAEVRKRMRQHAYSYENDLGKDASLLPFFKITPAQEAILRARSSTNWDMVQYWTDIANDANQEYPRLWKLRPDKSLTGDKIFAQILALPTETHKDRMASGETYEWTPAKVKVSNNRYYLNADTEDIVVVGGKIVGKTKQTEWVYRGRKINPDVHNNRWHIESFHPNFSSWKLNDTPANPVIEYLLSGSLRLNGNGYGDHPDAPSSDLNAPDWEHPSRFQTLFIYSSNVYGGNMGTGNYYKLLSFMDALNVAINWIAAFEYAYGVIQ